METSSTPLNLQKKPSTKKKSVYILSDATNIPRKCDCIICRIKKIQADCYRVTQQAIKKGEITKKPCEICGNIISLSHHEDYSRPLEVNWLCHKHHRQRHPYKIFSHFKVHFNPFDLTKIDMWNLKAHKEKIWFYKDLVKILESEGIKL